MVCPNCSSTDIIEIDSQHYCINCGQPVSELKLQPIPVKPSGLAPVAPALKPLPTPPKASHEAEKIKINLPPAPSPQPLEVKPALATPVTPQPPPEPHQAPKPPTHTLNLKFAANPDSHVLSRPKSAKPNKPNTPPAHSKADAKPPDTHHAAIKPPSQPEPQANHVQVSHVGVSPPSRIQFQARTPETRIESDHPIKSALRLLTLRLWGDAAIYCLTLSGLWLYLQLSINQNLQLLPNNTKTLLHANVQPLVVSASLAIIVIMILWLARAFIKAKFIYIIVKQLDQRHGSSAQAVKAGLASIWPLLGLDIIAGSIIGGLLLLELIGFHLIGLIPDQSGLVQPLLLTLTNIALVYFAIGTITARTLATRTSTLASRRASSAFSECWKLYWHYSGDIVIWGTESILANIVIVSPLALMLSVTHFASESVVWLAGLVLAAAVCSYLAFIFNLGFWTAIYYELCSFVPPSRRTFFVGAKQPKLASSQLILAIGVILASAGLSVSGWLYQANLSHWIVSVLKR